MRIQARTVKAADIFPLLGVYDGVLVSRRGALTLGWELSLPPVGRADRTGYDEMLSSLASAIRTLPSWSLVHRQDIYLYEAWRPSKASDSFLRRCDDAHFAGRRYLTHRALLYVTFGAKGLMTSKTSSSGLLQSFGGVHEPSPEEFARFRGKCSEFRDTLAAGGRYRLRELTEDDYFGTEASAGLVGRVMTLGGDGMQLSHLRLVPDAVGAFDRTAVSYVIGESDALPTEVDSVMRVEAMSTGRSDMHMSLGSRLGVALDCEHIVNQYILVPSQDEVLRSLDKERRKMYSGATNSADNRINAQEVQTFLDETYRDGLFTVQAHVDVVAWSDDSRLQETKGRVGAALTAMGVRAVYNNYDTPMLWYASLPGNGSDLGVESLMTMELRSALALCGYETFDGGMKGGMLRLCDRLRHMPVELDTQRLAQSMGLIGNFNMFLLGPSGTGKSFFMNNYLYCCWLAGESVFLIDVGDSYQGLCGVIAEESGGKDGAYLSWDGDHTFSFRFFNGLHDWVRDGVLHTDHVGVSFAMTFLQAAWTPDGGWSTDMLTVLKQMLTDFAVSVSADAPEPVFDDFYRYVSDVVRPRIFAPEDAPDRWRIGVVPVTPTLFNVEKFILALKDYAKDGCYGFLLNDPDPKDLFASRFTVFEVDKLSQDDRRFYSLCILCVINAMDCKMRSAEGFKNIVIDEAWKAIANETMAPYLRALWKTARKFATAAVVVTQEAEDIVSSQEIKTAIIDNSDIKILLNQSGHVEKFDALADMLSLNALERTQALSVGRAMDARYRYREAFVKFGSWSGVYALEVSEEEALAYESDKDLKRPILALAGKMGSLTQALRAKAEQWRRGTHEI